MEIFKDLPFIFYETIDSNIHKKIIDVLQMPLINNYLLYGTDGLQHDILIDSAMYKKYGKFKKNKCIWQKELIYFETPYFLEIDFCHVGQPKDTNTVINFLKDIISNSSLTYEKRIIILYNIHLICNKNKSYPFRVLLERFSSNNIFICSTNNISSIENPIKSRFILLRVPLLSCDDIKSILKHYNHSNKLSEIFINRNNLSLAILYSQFPDNIDPEVDLNYYYPPIIDVIKSKPTYEKIRNLSHKICIHDIPTIHLVYDFIKINPANAMKYISVGAYIDHLCILTNSYLRPIYIEYLLLEFIENIAS
jgi:hypothetical protein